MNKDAYGPASFDGDVEPILPDGWEEGMDIFADSEAEGEDILADEREDGSLDELIDEGSESEEEAPTTGEESEEEAPGADREAEESGPEKEPVSRIRKLKINHEEREIDLNELSDDDLIAHLQKSYAFDAMRDRENKQLYRTVYQQQVEAGMTDTVAKLVAKDAAGKAYSLTDEEEAQAEQASAEPKETAVKETAPRPAVRDYAQEVEQLKALYPDIKEVPDEVAKAASRGVSVLTAFLAYRDKERAKTVDKLKTENTVLKQNAASAAKAPVRGVTGGGKTSDAKKSSIFETAFDDGLRWR